MENKMTRRTWLQSSTAALACLALPEYALGAVAEKGGASRVWMTKEISPEALVRIYEALGRPAGGKVAVKISTGEPGGRNFLSPVLIKDLVRRVNGTIVECNTAYGGKRSRTEDPFADCEGSRFFRYCASGYHGCGRGVHYPGEGQEAPGIRYRGGSFKEL